MLNRILNKFRNSIGLVAISFGLIPFMSPKVQPIVFNFDKTVNFCEPGPKWPVEKLLTPAEKEVYAQLGRPEYFHLLWSPKGEIRLRTTIEQEWQKKGPKNMPGMAWVYPQRGEQVFFTNNSYYSQPLNDTESLVIKSGDPEVSKDLGSGVVEWTYYSTGKIYTIVDTKIVATKDFRPLGTFHK